jgi:hypothetical protein
MMMNETCEPKKKPATIREFLTSAIFIRPFLGVVIGGLAGYLYYHFVGCSSGTCAITSNPYVSTLFGGLMGFFVVNSPCAGNKC